MAKQTLQQIQAMIAQLQSQAAELERQAAELRAQETAGVVERIREAITAYALTERDIFGRHTRRPAKAAKQASRASKLRPRVVRFQDDSGNTWTGRGKRPNWFKAAIESGKSPDELAVRR